MTVVTAATEEAAVRIEELGLLLPEDSAEQFDDSGDIWGEV